MLKAMFYPIVHLIATLTMPHLSEQHYNPPLDICLLAAICNHTDIPQCGEEKNTLNKKLFLDECDMYEYNCDYKKSKYYDKIAYEECRHKENQVTNKLSTLVKSTTSSMTEDNTVSQIWSTTDLFSTYINTLKSTTNVGHNENQTIDSQNGNKTTSSHPKQNKSTEKIKETTDNLTVTQETTLSYSTESTSATTNKTNNICTRTQTTTLSTKTASDSPPQNVSGVQSETSTNSESTDHRNPVSFTTVHTFTTSNETSSTTKMAETTETTKSTEITTVKTTIETLVNSAPNEEASSVKFNSVSPRDPCSAYPKHCDRPTSWETTVKGETRDFYRILKARYGDRMKILKRTTNWARRMKYFNGIKPDF